MSPAPYVFTVSMLIDTGTLRWDAVCERCGSLLGGDEEPHTAGRVLKAMYDHLGRYQIQSGNRGR
jgi:hypothetical protein